MATINNTTVNSTLTIIFDADENPINTNDGPRLGSGNTESDVYVDETKVWFNIKSHTEINPEIHALQWNVTTNTGSIEYVDYRENENISSLPQWATNVVIRCEAQDVWSNTFKDNITSQYTSWIEGGNVDEDFVANTDSANSVADSARTTYLGNHGITF